jgi:hypothetical protein
MFYAIRFLFVAALIVGVFYGIYRAYKANKKLTLKVGAVVTLVAVLAYALSFLTYHTDTFTIM